MTTFIASKFDPSTDPSRPAVGTKVPYNGAEYVIKKVGYLTVMELAHGREPSYDGHSEILLQNHPTRPGVLWVCWVDPA